MPIKPENRGRYPREWPEIRERILKRAGDRCECRGECGLTHDAPCICYEGDTKRNGGCVCEPTRCEEVNSTAAVNFRGLVVLTIAHKDHMPENNSDENLAALCQRCHNRYDQPHRMATAAKTRHERTATGDLFS